jgi:hypothetical protein
MNRLLSEAILLFAVAWVFVLWLRAVLLCSLGDYDARDQMPMWMRRAILIFVLPVVMLLALAESGALLNFDPVPLALPIIPLTVCGVSLGIAFSPLGKILAKNLSWRSLVGFQTFRFLAEFVIFFGVQAEIAPVQLSFEGYNPDIYFALWSIYGYFNFGKTEKLWVIKIWNGLGIFSLLIILFIGVTSLPTPIRLFMAEPSNVWVTQVPFILLPGVLVTAALTGHFLAVRKFLMGQLESS